MTFFKKLLYNLVFLCVCVYFVVMGKIVNIEVKAEQFKIRGFFRISRGSKTVSNVITCIVTDAADPSIKGMGESVPYPHYGESIEQTLADITAIIPKVEENPSREYLLTLLPPGAARNAVDCALWDYEAKKSGKSVWELAGFPGQYADVKPMVTAFTLSLDTAENMAKAAAENAWRPLLKLKVGSEEDLDKVRAIRAAAPNSKLVCDANEGWSFETLEKIAPKLAELGVELVEQPMKAGEDLAPLRGKSYPGVVICADESMRGVLEDLDEQAKCYQAINIKLDKTGGLTHAITIAKRARELGLKIMVGCMVSTSLSMAPALTLAAAFNAEWVDLDGPLLLAEDRTPCVKYEGSLAYPPQPELWG